MVVNPWVTMVVIMFLAPRVVGIPVGGIFFAFLMTIGLMAPGWIETYYGAVAINAWIGWLVVLQVSIVSGLAMMLFYVIERWNEDAG